MLYNVILDGYKFGVVARDKNEAEKLCFSMFDYNSINISFTSKTLEDTGYPYLTHGV